MDMPTELGTALRTANRLSDANSDNMPVHMANPHNISNSDSSLEIIDDQSALDISQGVLPDSQSTGELSINISRITPGCQPALEISSFTVDNSFSSDYQLTSTQRENISDHTLGSVNLENITALEYLSMENKPLVEQINKKPKDTWIQLALQHCSGDIVYLSHLRLDMFAAAKKRSDFPKGELIKRIKPKSATGKPLDYKLAEDCHKIGLFIYGSTPNCLNDVLTNSLKATNRSVSLSETPAPGLHQPAPKSYAFNQPDEIAKLKSDFLLLKASMENKMKIQMDEHEKLKGSTETVLDALVKDGDRLESDIKGINVKYDSLADSMKKQEDASEKYQKLCDEYKQTNEHLKSRLDNMKSRHDDLNNKYANLEKSLNGYKKKCENLIKESNDLKKWKGQSTKTIDPLSKQCEKNENKLKSMERIMGDHVSVCSTQCTILERKLDSHSSKLNSLNDKIVNLKNELKRVADPSVSARSGCKSELKCIRQRLKAVEVDSKDFVSSTQSVKSSIGNLRSRLTAVENQYSDLEIHMINPTESDHDKDVLSMKTSIAHIHTRLSDIEKLQPKINGHLQRQINKSMEGRKGSLISQDKPVIQNKQHELHNNAMYGPMPPPDHHNTSPLSQNRNGDSSVVNITHGNDKSDENSEQENIDSAQNVNDENAQHEISTNENDHHENIEVINILDDTGSMPDIDQQPIPVRITDDDEFFQISNSREKPHKYYLGNINKNVTDKMITGFLSKKYNIFPTFINLKPNQVKPHFLGARLHIKQSDRHAIENFVHWPGYVYLRDWVPKQNAQNQY